MSPHIVDCAGGALEVGVTADAGAGAGAGAAKVKVNNRVWHWRTNVRRILMMATENDGDKKRRTRDAEHYELILLTIHGSQHIRTNISKRGNRSS